MKIRLIKSLFTCIATVFVLSATASLKINNGYLVADEDNALRYTFTAETSEPAQVYLSYTAKDKTRYTNVTDLSRTHIIHLIGLTMDEDIEIEAYAFNQYGETSLVLNNILISKTDVPVLQALQQSTKKQTVLEENVLLISDRGNGEEDLAFIIDQDGNAIWYETLPNSNENVDCNAVNYQNGYVLISDCHTITRKKLDGTEEMTYTLENDSVFSNSFFHDKAIINNAGNLVSLFAHKTVIDLSIIGGDSITQLVSDGIVEFDFETGERLFTFSPPNPRPTNFCPYYTGLNLSGKWAAVFGDNINYYRLATGIVQDEDNRYLLTLEKDTLNPAGIISVVSEIGRNCEVFSINPIPSSTNSQLILYQDDLFINPRSFSILPDGNYFMLSNYPDTMIMGIDTLIIPTGNGLTTRGMKYYLEFGYEGHFIMFWTVDEYRFPESAYTEMGSAIWMPNDHILGFSEANNTLYEINDTNEVTGEWQFSEALKVSSLVDDLYPDEIEVSINQMDTLLCNSNMEMFQLIGEPVGGFFEGVPLTDDNVFYPDSVEVGTYIITYNFGPLSSSIEITVDECPGIEELEAMGGLSSFLYPNPVQLANPMLKYRMAKAGDLQFEIYDLQGKLKEQMNLGYRSIGLSAETIDLSGYTNGVYVYRISSDNMQQFKRFAVAR